MADRVRVEPTKHIRVELGGKVIGETSRGVVSHEVGLPDRYYLPQDDVRAKFSDGSGTGVCPWKGKWKNLDVEVDGARVHNGAWTYYEPTAACEALRDKVAFYEDKVGTIDAG